MNSLQVALLNLVAFWVDAIGTLPPTETARSLRRARLDWKNECIRRVLQLDALEC
jgi:hypothetical protein